MIHQLLNLARPLFVIDCETTGVDPQRDRIVEVGFQRWTTEGMDKEWCSLINPGMSIPASATKVHGITDARMHLCNHCGLTSGEHSPIDLAHQFKPVPTFAQLAANFAKGFTCCDFAGKNVRFDLRIIAAEMMRAGVQWSYLGARIIDAERLEQLAEPRSLSYLHKKYVGHVHDGAHGALSDVRATTTVLACQLKVHQQLPRDLDALHAAQWPGWIDPEGKFRFVDGIPCFGGWGKYAGRPMREADASYWDFILLKDFSVDVKLLAGNAKLGKFPVIP